MFTEDLDVFFDATQGFAVSATYDAAGANTTVRVIHDAASLDQFGVVATNPVALGKASDFPDASARGKTLLIGATTYTIKSRRALDDGALVVLELND